MENLDMYNLKNKYKNNGTILVDYLDKLNPFTEDDIKKLAQYCNDVEKEFVEIGDAGEPNFLRVGRFMHYKEKPEMANNPYSKRVLDILNKVEVKEFVKKIIDTNKNIYVRRAQFNEISKNCFVGYHLDIDSNPDYIAACVIQLGNNYEGGLYRVYLKEDKNIFNDFKPNFGSLIVSDCNYPHEVTKVEKGDRKSLVFFVSHHKELNRRYS